MYRRRRLGVLCLGVMALAVASASGARAAAVRPGPLAVVAPGETLWALALQDAPASADPRRWVAEVEALNHLPGPQVQAGQELRLPAGSR